MLKSNASNEDISRTVEQSKDISEEEQQKSLLLFGSDLEKQPMVGGIEFGSDQESTGGEDDDQPLGKCCHQCLMFVYKQ